GRSRSYLPSCPPVGACRPHPLPPLLIARPQSARGGTAVTAGATVVSPVPPPALLEVMSRPRGEALMLGHVHPDADVLGTLLAIGRCLESRGWTITCAGPHPIPDALAFLPDASRWQTWKTAPRMFDVIVLTDCPNDERTEGLLTGARGASTEVLN